jgi:hypothetical protein
MRNFTLLVGAVLLLALAGTASAQCYGCNSPCIGPSWYECNYQSSSGYYGDCWNRGDCEGCDGWIDGSCLGFFGEDLQPKEPEPLLGVLEVKLVAVRHDPAPVRRPEPVQIALVH